MTSPPTIYRDRDFRSFLSARFVATTGVQIQSVAIAWQIYALSNSTLALGFVGLAEFLPMFLCTLPGGDLSDRFNQRKILAAGLAVNAVCAILFLVLTLSGTQALWPFYLVLTLFGAARGFSGPAGQSLIAFLVPPERLARSIALGSSVFMVAVIAGPALGGFLYAIGPTSTYATCAVAFLVAAVLVIITGGRKRDDSAGHHPSFLERVAQGVRFVRSRPVVLGAISLDLFAVLLGGAVALLPVYARDILNAGPIGLGFLRSAPAVGAAVVAVIFARWPLERRTGVTMFAAVATFGVATIVFGLSRNYGVSITALTILGASDMVSVFIRSNLIQFATPDAMRGRVSAVNMLFIGASNELGEFESGLTAAWLGTVTAVVVGGVGTLVVVALWMWMFPSLRTVDRLNDVRA